MSKYAKYAFLSILLNTFLTASQHSVFDDGQEETANEHITLPVVERRQTLSDREPLNERRPSTVIPNNSIGLDSTHIINIRKQLADEYSSDVKDAIWSRWFFRKSANINEAIGNTAGYFAMAATPAAGATMLICASATPYVVFAGSAAAVLKLFCMGLAHCSAREAAERQGVLDSLAGPLGIRTANLIPTITDPTVQADGGTR